MIANKYVGRMIAVIMAVTVCLCLTAVIFAEDLSRALGGGDITVEYEDALFDTDTLMEVNILMDEEDWEDLLANAMAEEYYECDVEINGETFYRVGIRTKGNTSLMAIASDPDTDRYSLKLEFDHYVDGQTCHGLDKLVLNNNYADATNMKEALIYDMYQYLGADASLYNYASISVNGEYWGVYLALEAVEDSFLLRNYGTESGALYKPESMSMGGSGGFSMSGFSMGGNGADLNYTDDSADSYSTIWEGEVTDTADGDHSRVITALRNISEGTDLEKYMDVDNLLRYMAVHVFSVNEDSLSGMMAHNYYLYESDGQLNILPWDYNLALGGMGGMGGKDGGDSATSVVNDAIDEAFSSTDFFDTLMENEEYRETYYGYLRQLAEEYIAGGGFDAFYDRTRSQIDSLVETDPTAFYTYDEYLTAAETLEEVVRLRGESISGQLDGTIPPLESEQRDSDALIDASHLDLSVMGSMNMGDSMRDLWSGEDGSEEETEEGTEEQAQPEESSRPEKMNMLQSEGGGMPEGFDMSQFGGGELPEDFDASQFGGGELPEDFDASQFGGGELPEDFDASQFGGGELPEDFDASQFGGGELPEDFDISQFGGGQSGMGSGGMSTAAGNLILYGACFAVLIAALVFARFYRRRRRRR